MQESGPLLLAVLFVRNDGVSIGELFITIENFLGQVRVDDVTFISARHESYCASGEALASAQMKFRNLLRQLVGWR